MKFIFDGQLNEREARIFMTEVLAFVQNNPGEKLWVGIQCMGGSPAPAAAVFEFLRGLPVETHGHVLGSVYSGGTTLLLGFKTRSVTPNAMIGVHSGRLTGINGELTEERALDLLSQIQAINLQLIRQLMDATGADEEKATAWVRKSRFWTPEKALEDKLVHSIERHELKDMKKVRILPLNG